MDEMDGCKAFQVTIKHSFTDTEIGIPVFTSCCAFTGMNARCQQQGEEMYISL